jgi:hypothetical protein
MDEITTDQDCQESPTSRVNSQVPHEAGAHSQPDAGEAEASTTTAGPRKDLCTDGQPEPTSGAPGAETASASGPEADGGPTSRLTPATGASDQAPPGGSSAPPGGPGASANGQAEDDASSAGTGGADRVLYHDREARKFRSCRLIGHNPARHLARIQIDGAERVSSPGDLFHARGGVSLDESWRILIRAGKPYIVFNVPPQGRPWQRRAWELRDWTIERLANRRDCYGSYYCKDGLVKQATRKCDLSLDRILLHFWAGATQHIIGLHAAVWTPNGCLSQWLCIDIDWHEDGEPPEATWLTAVTWYTVLVRLGFHPLLLDSNGHGGFRIYVLFKEPVPTHHARLLGLWLVQDWAEMGLTEEPEVFPAQLEITPPGSEYGSYGNWLRIPGRHHKRPHWSRVWDGERWLEGDDAIDAILATVGDDPASIPPEALVVPDPPARRTVVPAPRPHHPPTGESSERSEPENLQGTPNRPTAFKKARQALNFLKAGVRDPSGREYISNYWLWYRIGMSLRELGDPGLNLWIKWSARCQPKYDPATCHEKWRTFGSGDITLGWLIWHARQAGWQRKEERP